MQRLRIGSLTSCEFVRTHFRIGVPLVGDIDPPAATFANPVRTFRNRRTSASKRRLRRDIAPVRRATVPGGTRIVLQRARPERGGSDVEPISTALFRTDRRDAE